MKVTILRVYIHVYTYVHLKSIVMPVSIVCRGGGTNLNLGGPKINNYSDY